jgi:ABC-2 type transport system ATP-binding protein
MQVVVENLSKAFGKSKAVDDLSFSLAPSQVTAFVGPNGAGKTTTMRIMSTLEQPDTGRVLFDGRSIIEYPEMARRQLGYMPDALPAHRDIVVHEYLDFFARAFGLRGAARRRTLDQIMEFTALGPIREKTLFALSKGMKQRVSLARALVHDPPLLILDEPAAGLDPRARVELRQLLVALAERGKTVLISSHILNELEEMSQGAVIIELGRLVRAGSFEELERHPDRAHLTTRRIAIRGTGEDASALHRAILQLPGVHDARASGAIVVVELEGGDEGAADLLGALVAGGHRIVEFRVDKAGLERLFIQMTRGAVQ